MRDEYARPRSFAALVAGLGGQGVLFVSRIISRAASQTYPFVCRTESRGLSQRGGSVCSLVRCAQRAVAPVVGGRGADLVLGLDALEAARALPQLGPAGYLVTNAEVTPPLHLLKQWQEGRRVRKERLDLQNRIAQVLRAGDRNLCLDVKGIIQEAHCPGMLNTVLLGAASHFLPLPSADLRQALASTVRTGLLDANLTAYDAGRRACAHKADGSEAPWAREAASERPDPHRPQHAAVEQSARP